MFNNDLDFPGDAARVELHPAHQLLLDSIALIKPTLLSGLQALQNATATSTPPTPSAIVEKQWHWSMFDFTNQALDSTLGRGVDNTLLFDAHQPDSQYFSKKGIQIGPISYSDGSLNSDFLWDISTLREYSPRTKARYSALLTLVDSEGSVNYIKNLTTTARGIFNRKIPESASFEISEYLDDIIDGGSLFLGVSQSSKTGQKRRGSVAMATSIDLTDLITGQNPTGNLKLMAHSGSQNLYTPKSTSECANKKIGIDADLQNCKFEYVPLDNIKFGYSNQDQPPKYRQPVNLSGASFEGSSLRNTEWGWTGIDIINDIWLPEHSYAQEWTSVDRKNDPSAATSLRRANLENALFWVNDNAKSSPYNLNSFTIQPATPPFADYAKLTGMRMASWGGRQDKQMPTFATIYNSSDRDIEISSVYTNIFRTWSTTLKKGESFQAWGTTGQFLGNDIVIQSPGVEIVANNPTVAEANVKVNGSEVDNSDTIRYSQGGIYVNWLGNQNGAKSWEIRFVN